MKRSGTSSTRHKQRTVARIDALQATRLHRPDYLTEQNLDLWSSFSFPLYSLPCLDMFGDDVHSFK